MRMVRESGYRPEPGNEPRPSPQEIADRAAKQWEHTKESISKQSDFNDEMSRVIKQLDNAAKFAAENDTKEGRAKHAETEFGFEPEAQQIAGYYKDYKSKDLITLANTLRDKLAKNETNTPPDKKKDDAGFFDKLRRHSKGVAMVALFEMFGMNAASAAEKKVEAPATVEVAKAQNQKVAMNKLKKEGMPGKETDLSGQHDTRETIRGEKELKAVYDSKGKEQTIIAKDGNKFYVDLDGDGTIDRIAVSDAKEDADRAFLELTMRGDLKNAVSSASLESGIPASMKRYDWRLYAFEKDAKGTTAYSIDSKTGNAGKMTSDSAAALRNKVTTAYDEVLGEFTK
jgi:hypothetical protein